ncbi:MAG: 4Fe-4S binding protein [Planctomycetes bacterium]|nr:4Fe-4S binding protein [Planctomycetota bacterium]
MAETTSTRSAKSVKRRNRLPRLRPWVQTLFLSVWLAPISYVHGIPGCVLHCYACPLASFACPIGVAAQFSAMHALPLMVFGAVVLAGSLVGSLVCGWACPFGFIQDLLGRIRSVKFRLPAWTGYFRYVVLLVAVVAVPYFWGTGHSLFICRICPSGALEGGVGQIIYRAATGQHIYWPSAAKWAILAAFVVAAIVTYRPWCKVFCPLGGVLALFNRISVFHMRYESSACTECNTCRSRCMLGVNVDQSANSASCIRCLECTKCGAIQPAVGFGRRPKDAKDQLDQSRAATPDQKRV